MEEHPNVKIVRRTCKALQSIDAEAIHELFSAGSEFLVSGRNALAGVYVGPAGILEFASKRQELSDGTFKAILHDVIASDRHSVAILRFMAKRPERRLDVRIATLFHVFDGSVAGGVQLSADPYSEDEFWG